MKRRNRTDRLFSERHPLRFECTRCGACCTGGDGEHVFLDDAEAHAICGLLGLSWRWFSRRYLSRSADGERTLRMTAAGACIFLRPDGGCGVYPARPLQCRTYPFWPEAVHSQTSWHREARRCEGIGRGARVALRVVRAMLAKARAVTGNGSG